MKIVRMLKTWEKNNYLKKVKDSLQLSSNSYYGNNFQVEFRNRKKGRTYLAVGDQSIIDGTFIFERESGYVSIGERVHIGSSTFISISEIRIGNDVTIAWDCVFYDHNSHPVPWDERKQDTIIELQDLRQYGDMIRNKNWDHVISRPIVIKDKAWIGFGGTILKGVTIGEGAVVAAKSVVVKDIEPYTVVGGNPAQVIKRLDVK